MNGISGGVNRSKWFDGMDDGWKGSKPRLNLASNAVVANGQLCLFARNLSSSARGLPLGYGNVSTSAVASRAAQLFGYFEIRARLLNSSAIKSAFWFNQGPQIGSVARQWHNEIDVFEMVASSIHCGTTPCSQAFYSNLHQMDRNRTTNLAECPLDPASGPNKWRGEWTSPTSLAVGFHTIALHTEPGAISWLVDGVVARTVNTTCFDKEPLHLVLDLEADGFVWGNEAEARAELPRSFDIDYVRSWRRVSPSRVKKTDDDETTNQPITVTVSATPIFTVLPAFVSFTIDSASLCSTGWTFPANVDPVTLARVRLLSEPGLVIRFGGTSADNEQLTQPGVPLLPRLATVVRGGLGQDSCNITALKWHQLLSFAASVNASLVYGVDSLLRVGAKPRGAIDLRNADGLLALASSSDPRRKAALMGLELGNEPTSWATQHYTNLTPAEHAADFGALRRSVARSFKGGGAAGDPLPRILGPDVYGLTKRDGTATTYLTSFLAAKPELDIVTIHLYPLLDIGNVSAQSFANESLLNISRQSALAARSIVDRAAGFGVRTPLWVGEGSPSWRLVCNHGCGALKHNLTFELANLDMLGSFAASGVELFARQCLNSIINPQTDTSGGATPGYWTSILWKQLMGDMVLNVSSAASYVRSYAHAKPDSITLMLLNLRGETTQVAPSFRHFTTSCKTSTTAQRWTLEAGPNQRNCTSWGDW